GRTAPSADGAEADEPAEAGAAAETAAACANAAAGTALASAMPNAIGVRRRTGNEGVDMERKTEVIGDPSQGGKSESGRKDRSVRSRTRCF
ncbi:hypothetical protein, partial [Burkholderia multivorans]|uniref:hypothetical protein n=1 Tax=Burkholderia multivorans TaxID=87883 RepID=UPI0035A25D97